MTCNGDASDCRAARERDELRAQVLSTTKALALVEMALESAEGTHAVQRQTGGTAPESVQGILDGVVELRARVEKAEARVKELEAVVESMGDAHDDKCNQGDLCDCTRKLRREIADDALAQKPGAEGAGTARPSGPELKEPKP